MLKPALYLIPVTLGESAPGRVLPEYNSEIIRQLDEFIVENIRSARRFLKSIGYQKDLGEVTFHLLNQHTAMTEVPGFIRSVKEGKAVGLLSEAGTPCIADPGNVPVRLCREAGLQVIPLVGPNSIILALMASGFNGQHFTFHGYLPVEKNALKRKIKTLEQFAYKNDQTQIFIETPYRNTKLFDTLLEVCSGQTQLCVAKNLTLQNEEIRTETIARWKTLKPDLHKQPCVFLIYR
jgi:16S rRNA (cytidine1402-2'-O)-methyltransferase